MTLAAFAVCIIARRSVLLLSAFMLITIACVATISSVPALASMLRLDELGNDNSSGFGRLVLPPIWLGRLVMDGTTFFQRRWRGGALLRRSGSAWPVVKLTYEYGLAAAIAYAVFILANVSRASLPVLLIPLLLVHQVTGGYLVQPVWIGPGSLCSARCLSSSRKTRLAMGASEGVARGLE